MEPSVSNILSDASAIYQVIAEQQDQETTINDAIDATEDIKESGALKQESYHDLTARELTVHLLRSVTGTNPLAARGLRLESASNVEADEATQTVDQIAVAYWEGLKQLFNNTWARYKEWYHVISSAAEALIVKANKVRVEALKLTDQPKVRVFDFKDFKGLLSDSRQVDAHSVQGGLQVLETLVTQTLSLRKVTEFENMIKTSQKSLDEFVKSETAKSPDSSWVERFNGVYRPAVGIPTNPLTKDYLIDQVIYDPENAEYKQTITLLGGTAVVYSSVKPTSTLELGYKLGLVTAIMVDVIPEDSELHGKHSVPAKTLYSEQMTDCCDTVIKICEQVAFFDKAWARRDAFMVTVLADLEKTVNAFKDQGETITDYKSKLVSESLRATLAAIRRSNVFNASVINTSLKAANSAVNYCEASIAQYQA